jgi:hypothetical protein
MKRKSSRLAEVQLDRAFAPPAHSSIPIAAGSAPAFAVHLPEGTTVTLPPGFDPDEVFALLTVVREALR